MRPFRSRFIVVFILSRAPIHFIQHHMNCQRTYIVQFSIFTHHARCGSWTVERVHFSVSLRLSLSLCCVSCRWLCCFVFIAFVKIIPKELYLRSTITWWHIVKISNENYMSYAKCDIDWYWHCDYVTCIHSQAFWNFVVQHSLHCTTFGLYVCTCVQYTELSRHISGYFSWNRSKKLWCLW